MEPPSFSSLMILSLVVLTPRSRSLAAILRIRLAVMLASVWGGYGNSEVYEKAPLTADGAPPPTNAGGVTASGWSPRW